MGYACNPNSLMTQIQAHDCVIKWTFQALQIFRYESITSLVTKYAVIPKEPFPAIRRTNQRIQTGLSSYFAPGTMKCQVDEFESSILNCALKCFVQFRDLSHHHFYIH